MYRSIYDAVMHQMRTILRENVLRYRTAQNQTQSELAEASEIALRTVQKIEYGEVWPSDEMIGKIAKGLRIEAHMLFMPQLEPDKAWLISAVTKMNPSMVNILKLILNEVSELKSPKQTAK
jgi:transcriptional regulator with XRE-family HTH domain